MAKVCRTISILLLGIFLFFLCMHAKKIEGNQETQSMLSFCDSLIEVNSYYWDRSLMEEWCDKEHQDILEKNKDSYLAEYMLIQGELQLYQDNPESAIDKLRNAIELAGDNKKEIKAKAYAEVLKTYVSDKKYELVLEPFEKLLELYQNNEITYSMVKNGVTTCYVLLDAPNGNVKALELMKMIKTSAENANYENMSYVLYNMGIFSDENEKNVLAINYFQQALEKAQEKNLNEFSTHIYLEIAYLYVKDGNYEAALEYLNNVEIHKQDAEYLENLQQKYELYYSAYMGLENYGLAEEFLKKDYEIVQLLSEKYGLQDYYAQYDCLYASYLVKIGKYENALLYIDEASEIYHNTTSFVYTNFDLDIMTHYADVYFSMENYEKAAECYQHVYDMYMQKGYENPNAEVIWRIYKSYEETGNIKASFYADKAFSQLRQQLVKAEEQQAIYRFEEYVSKSREDEIQSLTERNHIIIQIIFLLLASVAVAIAFIVLAVRKNTKIRELNAKLEELNGKDALTGLFNRRTLEKALREEWINSRNRAVAMIDVDFFKLYNDTYGHQKGDMVLKAVAKCIADGIDENCIAARYGGEEFVILFLKHNEAEVVEALERIVMLLRKKAIPHRASAVHKSVTLSVGYTMAENLGGEQAISNADKALYCAKKTRNTIQTYAK